MEFKKHVGLIHSANKLSLVERKIANALLYNAFENLKSQDEHVIHMRELCALIGYNSKDYKTIKQSLISLISTVLEWNLLDKDKAGEGVWMASAMLSDAKIEGHTCTYSYSNRMRELCYYPEFYGRLNMQVLAKFKSSYGLALYENCIRYQDITQTPWFDIATYRKLMGVKDNEYPIFRDLNRRVIALSVKEVNAHSSIFVEPELKRLGKAVQAIRFLIVKQTNQTVLAQPKNNENIVDRLSEDYGLSAKQIENALQKYGEAYLLEKMKIIEASSSYQNGKIENLAKYLEKALDENYQPPKSSQENINKLKSKMKKSAEIRRQQENNLQEYRIYQNKKLPEIFNNLQEKMQAGIKKSFDAYISSTLYYSIYAKDGLNNPLIQDRFGDFVRKQHPELLNTLLSFEDFCKEGVLCA